MISTLASITRFIFRALRLIGFLLFVLFPTLMLINHYRMRNTEAGDRQADAVAVRLGRWLAGLYGLRVEVSGKPVEGPVLFAANHISWLDIPVLHSGAAMGFVAKAEIDNWPLFSYIARTGGTIFHQRGNHDSAADVSLLMEERLQQGRAVTIFPEGGIVPDAPIRVFHARLFRAAVDAGCPVQPVMVRYMRDGRIDEAVSFRPGESMTWNLARQLARPPMIAEVHFLPAIDATGKPRRQLADAARAAVVGRYEA